MKQLERVKEDIAGINTAIELAGYLDGLKTAIVVWCKEKVPYEVYEKQKGNLEVTIYGEIAYLESDTK